MYFVIVVKLVFISFYSAVLFGATKRYFTARRHTSSLQFYSGCILTSFIVDRIRILFYRLFLANMNSTLDISSEALVPRHRYFLSTHIIKQYISEAIVLEVLHFKIASNYAYLFLYCIVLCADLCVINGLIQMTD